MEELSIEQKAKAYDKALKVLHKYDGANIMFSQSLKEEMFPELKESEDERIKQLLLRFVKYDMSDNYSDDFTPADCVAWLEKQGEHANFHNKIQIGDKVTRNEDGVLVNLSQLNRVAKKDEKQGERRSKLIDFALNANDSDLQEATYFIPKGFHAEIIGDKVVIKKGEKKSAEWSEEDDEIHKKCICSMRASACGFPEEEKFVEKVDNWLNELKNRVGCEANCITTKEWSEEDENYFNAIISVIKKNRSLLKLDDWDITWLRFLKYRAQAQPEQQWSEEDKMQLDAAIHLVSSTGHIETANWLKALKDRVQLRPQQGWSEEDEMMITFALTYFRTRGALEDSNIIKWLKSLKDRMQLHGGECYNPYKEAIESIIEMCQRYDKLNLLDSIQDFYNNVKVKCKDAKEYDSLNS